MATIDVRHDGLGRLERVWAPTRALAEQRAAALAERWQSEFVRRQAVPGLDALGKAEAADRTVAAEQAVSALTSILFKALRQPATADWVPLYDTSTYGEAPPVTPPPPQHDVEPSAADFPRAPLNFLTLINPRAMRRRREAAETKFQTAHDGWTYLKRWREGEHDKALSSYRTAFSAWQTREAAFLEGQGRANARIDALIAGYAAGEAQAVIGHTDLALLALERPAGFPCFWVSSFADGALQIDYDLPSMDVVPVLKAVKYVPGRQGFDSTALPEAERQRLYGEAVFQTVLAVLHTIFASDSGGTIRAVSFNGWANFIDGSAMRPGRACILALAADKEAFQSLNLDTVDPKACVRALNGSVSPKLAALVGY